jgi:glycosyltransferase involved in cell wall biosynthesis
MDGRAGEGPSTMKILVLTTLHAPDDDRIYYKEALSLCRDFSDVTLVAPNDGGQAPDIDRRIRFLPLRQRRGPLGRVLKLLAATRAVWRIGPDIVHFHDYDILLAAPTMRYLLRCRLVYDAHEDFPASALMSERFPRTLRPAMARLVRLFEITLARCCTLIIAADTPTAEYLSETGVPVRVLFNYPRPSLFPSEETGPDDNRELFVRHSVITYHGTMSADRGLFHMIRAMPGILARRANCRLLLIGLSDDGLRRRVLALADELGVREAVFIVPWVPHVEVHRYLSRSKIGLVPLQPEEKYKRNIPIKLFECMTCGLPVLAADLPSIRPYVEESKAGLLYDSTSPEALAEGVIRMLADEETLRQMGENGRRAVQEKWNWHKMEERLFEAYDGLDAQVRQRRAGTGRGQTRSVSSR